MEFRVYVGKALGSDRVKEDEQLIIGTQNCM